METPSLSHKQFLKIDKDYTKAAKVADLHYVNDRDPGIKRNRKGEGFTYTLEGKTVKDKETLERIRKLAIPPAWTDVWICAQDNGHIQATGIDGKGRKQYRYHAAWHLLRNETKFHRMFEFGKLLPSLRLQLEEDLARKELPEEKVIATVISLMERTFIRVGSNDYEKLYGSYGLTTFKDKHVKIEGDKMHFSFRGKKGVDHSISLKNRRLARAVQACRDLPGKELFQYVDADGNRKTIDSGKVNAYIKQATGGDFSAKDFRTWAGTLSALRAFCNMTEVSSDSELKKNVVQALDEVSKQLGNTRTVCKKYYVHPGIIRLYEEQGLNKYLKELDAIEETDELTGLTSEERVLMKILTALV
ncbi:DNA topoisomerase-1 [Cnuella takakiae]|uniref:DNA topoisomerase-1 n=1 Tax=Cnuella takakiae TaxID=1302690 RepID=A0A1M5FQ46_9BACT|nr:DNA topoisomerase IB [Cnuella takakiae]OLY93675.1 DNA topoisomerase I [Cnuella takakiae]SHF93677.1 DNA topoisomerase-1 [Cnuella takakiae]